MNEQHYRNWLITPELLSVERSIHWFRPPGGYLYVRESLLMEPDHGCEIDPYHGLENCELLAIGVCVPYPQPRRNLNMPAPETARNNPRGPRRCWFILHEQGDYLDGITLPPKGDEYGGFIVKVDPRESTVLAGEYSPLGISEREISPAEVAEAIKHRDKYLAAKAAHEAEQARLRSVRAGRWARKLAEVQRPNPYKAPANELD